MPTERQRELVIGSLLGDGYLEKRGKKHATKFSELVKPYILPEFRYKLPGDNTVGTQTTGTRRD